MSECSCKDFVRVLAFCHYLHAWLAGDNPCKNIVFGQELPCRIFSPRKIWAWVGMFSISRACDSQGRFAWLPNSRPRLIFHIRLSCRCAGRAVSQPRSVNSCVRFKIVFLSRKKVGADRWISRRETIGWAQWTTSHFKSCAVGSLRGSGFGGVSSANENFSPLFCFDIG